MRLSSANTRSGETCASAGAWAVTAAPVAGSISRLELDREADGAQRAQRVVGEGARGDHPQPPRGEVGGAAVRVDGLAAGQRLGDRVDREVARGEVGGEVAVAQRDEVDLPRPARRHHPPGAEGVRERERGPAGRAREAPGGGARVAGQRDVEVRGDPPEEPVAHGPAHEPRVLALERGTGSGQRVGRAHAGVPSRWCSRGTRAEIPHTTS